MMTDQHLPLLEATPMLAEMPLHQHVFSRDGMQQVSEPERGGKSRSSDSELFFRLWPGTSSEQTLRDTDANF